MIVEVILDLPMNRRFDYIGVDVTPADCGRCVRVPWGKGEKIGVIRALKAVSEYPVEKLKPILEIWRHVPPLIVQDWKLIEFASRYYQYPLGQTALSVFPPALRRTKGWHPKRVWKWNRHKEEKVSSPCLNAEQQGIVDAILAKTGFAVHLVYGITGSGKTEVYLSAMEAVLARGKQVLLLVPEINLTPQLEARIARRWPELPWVSLNSSVSETERAQRWLAAQRGEARLVLGTRLSVLTPLPELGMIVVDEEHDTSFKQQEGLRYSARDLAIVRAHQGDLPIVLGSATPSLESWMNAQTGRYHLHVLRHRALDRARLPQLHLAPTKQSEPLWLKPLAATLARGEQALVFINRRGYAPVLICTGCGWQAFCRHCSVRMVVHRHERSLRCHHCGVRESVPESCPSCGNVYLETRGDGTQKLEGQLREWLPEARIQRLDADTLSRQGAWRTAFEKIVQRKVNLLVGTQLVVKGHDFPQLSLVVVLNADQALFSSDFRATERMMAQLTQVAGRAGRADIPGHVWIETDYPEHPLYQALRAHEIEEFWQQELTLRQKTGWPPYSYLALLRCESSVQSAADEFMTKAMGLAQDLAQPGLVIYDPVPALLQRKAGQHRRQMLVQSGERGRLQAFLQAWRESLGSVKLGRHTRWNLDVDPLEC